MASNIAEKKNNTLPLWGNEKTMNLNSLILTNILSSHYFKVNLYQLKTYHEVIDEIYYQVTHLEPWEKGSRKTSGQTGMCGGVRGVGAGGIVSTAFCILYKLFTLKLTRKQVVGLINHADSPYIRALGFMYIRYTQPPSDLWDWYENYLSDPEELDVKAGGGQIMTIGEMLRHFLSKLEWFSTLFPRIPVPIQKEHARKLADYRVQTRNKSLSAGHDVDELPVDSESLVEKVDSGSLHKSSSSYKVKSKDGLNDYKGTNEPDIAEEINREKMRQRKEKHSKSSESHHYHSDREKKHSHHRHRSRSPIENDVRSSHRKSSHKKKHRKRSKERQHDKNRSSGSHRSRERSRSIERHKHRSHGSSSSKPHREENDDFDSFSKHSSRAKIHSHERDSDKKHRYSLDHDRGHEKYL